jgi:hypothetical protein
MLEITREKIIYKLNWSRYDWEEREKNMQPA